MTVTLGGINLGNEVVLRGLDAPAIETEVTRSEGGVAHILIAPMEGGRSLELDGTFTYAQETSIHAMIAAGVSVALSHPRFSGNVLVLSTSLTDDLVELVNPRTTDEKIGTIQLIEV